MWIEIRGKPEYPVKDLVQVNLSYLSPSPFSAAEHLRAGARLKNGDVFIGVADSIS